MLGQNSDPLHLNPVGPADSISRRQEQRDRLLAAYKEGLVLRGLSVAGDQTQPVIDQSGGRLTLEQRRKIASKRPAYKPDADVDYSKLDHDLDGLVKEEDMQSYGNASEFFLKDMRIAGQPTEVILDADDAQLQNQLWLDWCTSEEQPTAIRQIFDQAADSSWLGLLGDRSDKLTLLNFRFEQDFDLDQLAEEPTWIARAVREWLTPLIHQQLQEGIRQQIATTGLTYNAWSGDALLNQLDSAWMADYTGLLLIGWVPDGATLTPRQGLHLEEWPFDWKFPVGSLVKFEQTPVWDAIFTSAQIEQQGSSVRITIAGAGACQMPQQTLTVYSVSS